MVPEKSRLEDMNITIFEMLDQNFHNYDLKYISSESRSRLKAEIVIETSCIPYREFSGIGH